MQYDVKVRVKADLVFRVDATSEEHAFDVAMGLADNLFDSRGNLVDSHHSRWPQVVRSNVVDTEVLDTDKCD